MGVVNRRGISAFIELSYIYIYIRILFPQSLPGPDRSEPNCSMRTPDYNLFIIHFFLYFVRDLPHVGEEGWGKGEGIVLFGDKPGVGESRAGTIENPDTPQKKTQSASCPKRETQMIQRLVCWR